MQLVSKKVTARLASFCYSNVFYFIFIVDYSFVYIEERLIRAPNVRWAHGFEKHRIVVAKLTNTVSSYSQEGTIYALIGLVASRLRRATTKRVLLNFDIISQVCNNACMCMRLGCIDHLMRDRKHVFCGITDPFLIGA